MTYGQCCRIFGITDILSLPSAALDVVLGDRDRRNDVFRQLLESNDYDMGADWFQEIYESEMSEGKRKGQHFTPRAVYELVSMLTGDNASCIHEPTAGTGGLVIGDWWRRCRRVLPWEWVPSRNIYHVWELSERAVPLLLVNLAVRGIMAVVYHGDVLEQNVIHKYLVVNHTDNPIGFSDVYRDDNNTLKVIKTN